MRRILPVLAALALLLPAHAQGPSVSEPGLSVSSSVDWASSSLVVDISRTLDPSIPALPKAKETAQADIADRLDGILMDALGPVIVDSSHTFGEVLGSDPALFASVADLAAGVAPQQVTLSRDFSALNDRYSLPFFGPRGIASPLFPSQSNPPHRRLGYVTTRRYTGLLIYAKGPLPYVGTEGTKLARPALFPRIWDEEMDLVLDKGMCNPEDLARWGMVGYAQSLEDSATLRAGASPLRLAARGVFGDNATDLVISNDGAAQLLSLPDNVAALQQGRIVIVYESLP